MHGGKRPDGAIKPKLLIEILMPAKHATRRDKNNYLSPGLYDWRDFAGRVLPKFLLSRSFAYFAGKKLNA